MTTQQPDFSSNSQQTLLRVSNYNGRIIDVIEETKKFIMNNNCFFLSVDISGLNLIDATKMCILCSTFHYSKYCGLDIAGAKVKWVVKDEFTKSQIEMLKLDNIEIEVKKARRNYADYDIRTPRVLSICK